MSRTLQLFCDFHFWYFAQCVWWCSCSVFYVSFFGGLPKRCNLYCFSSCCKKWETHVFSTSPSRVAAWQVKYGTELSPIFLPTFAIKMATFKNKTLMTEALQFFLSLQNSEEKHDFFNILFKGGSVAGAVKNQILAFFPTCVSNMATFKIKNAYDPNIVFFWTSPSKVAEWQVKYGTKLSPIFCQHLPSKWQLLRIKRLWPKRCNLYRFSRKQNMFFQYPLQK